MPERPKAILFDIGNVLVRLKTGEFLKKISEACPSLPPERMTHELRDPESRHIAYERGEISGRDFHAHLAAAYGLPWGYEAWLAVWNDYFLPNRPMDVLLAKLRHQLRFWALSNTNAEHFRHLRQEYRLFDGFEGLVGSHEHGQRKPEPRLYEIALEKMKLPAASVVYIDDLERNVEAARALGMPAFHYTFNDPALRGFLSGLGLEIPAWDKLPSPYTC